MTATDIHPRSADGTPNHQGSAGRRQHRRLQLLTAEIEAIPSDLRGTDFPFEGRDRSIRDVICHLHELFTKRLYSWTGSTSLGAYLVSSTSSHYDWGKKVKRLSDS